MRLNIRSMNTPTLLALLLLSPALVAQEKKEGPIQDNSFLVEEAYNQETGVVQHISTFSRNQDTKDWVYTFTQEWPVGSIKHQFSFTLPWQNLPSLDGKPAFGDVLLNYRYQLLGDGDAKLAVSPRFSVILPTGNERLGYGKGAVGYQANLPVSWAISEALVAHTNLGLTHTPSAKNMLRDKATTRDLSLGQSLIWLVHPRFNVMLEAVHTRAEAVVAPGQVQSQNSTFISPGIRWAHNFPSGLQIVPGIAMPLGVGASKGEKAIFLYISFEHPFLKSH